MARISSCEVTDVRRTLLSLLLLLATAAAARPITLAWDASPAWPAGTTVELLANGVTASGITSSTHTLDIELAPGAVLDARARAVGPDGTLSDWATLVQTMPNEQRDLWAARDDGEVAPPMAAAFVSVGSGYNGAAVMSTITATLATVNAGDLLVAFVQRDDIADLTGVTTSVATLSEIISTGTQSGSFGSRVYAGIASSGGSSVAVTANFSASAQWGALVVAVYSGISSTTPLAYQCMMSGCTGLASSSTNRTTPSALTPGEEALIVAVGSGWDYEQTHTAADSFTKRFDNSVSTSTQFLLDRITSSNTGGGTVFATTSTSDQYFGALVAFKQSGGAAAASTPPKSGLTAMRHILGR